MMLCQKSLTCPSALMRTNLDYMRMCEELYLSREAVLRPTDPRMEKVNFAVHTWMLRLSGVIHGSWSLKPTQKQLEDNVVDEWLGFRTLWTQSKKGRLEGTAWQNFGKEFDHRHEEVIHRADIIAATPAVVASETLKSKAFHDVISDETSATTALETLSSWRSTETLILIGDNLRLEPPVFTSEAENPFYRIMRTSTFATNYISCMRYACSAETLIPIGDDLQQDPPVFTGRKENPFYRTMQDSTFARLRDLHFPAFLLKEQMHMPRGMMHLSNDIVYDKKLTRNSMTASFEIQGLP